MVLLSFLRQNNFYQEHKNDEDYKYMKKYSSYKSKARAFVIKFASKQDLVNLKVLIDKRLYELKGLNQTMKTTLDEAYRSGIELAKKLGDMRHSFANKLTVDLHPLAVTEDAKRKQEALHKWSSDYLAACIQTNMPAFDKFIIETDIEKKIKIAFSITGALTGDPE